jgi:abequosyltransferase
MRLSVCVPTYNRAAELPALLDSIAEQRDHGFEVEVVVSDNASTDNTEEVVRSYTARVDRLVYSRSESNLGYDRNVLRAVSLATGGYCWLMGSDDKFESSAFAELEKALAVFTDVGGVSIARRGYLADLRTPMPLPELVADRFDRPTILHGVDEMAGSIGLALGSLCALVVERSAWDEVARSEPVERYLNSYIQTYMALQVMRRKGTWLCVPARLVGYRSGNDSFAEGGRFKRMQIDVVGYDQNFGDVLGRGNPVFRRLMSDVAVGHVRRHLLGAKLHGERASFWRRSLPLLLRHYGVLPRFWTEVLPLMAVPGFVLRALHALHRRRRPA